METGILLYKFIGPRPWHKMKRDVHTQIYSNYTWITRSSKSHTASRVWSWHVSAPFDCHKRHSHRAALSYPQRNTDAYLSFPFFESPRRTPKVSTLPSIVRSFHTSVLIDSTHLSRFFSRCQFELSKGYSDEPEPNDTIVKMLHNSSACWEGGRWLF